MNQDFLLLPKLLNLTYAVLQRPCLQNESSLLLETLSPTRDALSLPLMQICSFFGTKTYRYNIYLYIYIYIFCPIYNYKVHAIQLYNLFL